MTTKPVRVLVVDDSAVERDLLSYLLARDTRLQVAGTAADGEAALAEVARLKPDVITMDLNMPKLDGIDATRRIMETVPTPIVIVSGCNVRTEVAAGFRAIEAGALAIVEKPLGIEGEEVRRLVDTVRLMAEVKVVRRWPRHPPPPHGAVGVVAIGASTGGPLALRTVLAGLPRNFPVPIAIVQHMSPGFTEGFGDWLAQTSGFAVEVAGPGEALLPGHAYLAPDGAHLLVTQGGGNGRAALAAEAPENGHLPSVSRLFRSAAEVFGSAAIAVLLSGMGRDGAAELKLLREAGALTIAQSPETSVVAGMPGEAIALGAAVHVLPPHRIPAVLQEAVARQGRASHFDRQA